LLPHIKLASKRLFVPVCSNRFMNHEAFTQLMSIVQKYYT